MGSSYTARKDAIVIAGRFEAPDLPFLKHHHEPGKHRLSQNPSRTLNREGFGVCDALGVALMAESFSGIALSTAEAM
jgi:hypothetical protein